MNKQQFLILSSYQYLYETRNYSYFIMGSNQRYKKTRSKKRKAVTPKSSCKKKKLDAPANADIDNYVELMLTLTITLTTTHLTKTTPTTFTTIMKHLLRTVKMRATTHLITI